MSSQLPLGFQFNLGRNASGGTNRASFRDCSNYLFVVDTPVTGSTITFTEANATTGGTSQVLANGTGTPIVTYYTQTAGVWSAVTTGYVVATGILTITGTFDQVAVWVNQGALSDGFSYLSASHGTGTFVYIMGDLDVQRFPSNLRDVRA